MKDLWKGIAILGIWLGIGMCVPTLGENAISMAFFAMFATAAVSFS